MQETEKLQAKKKEHSYTYWVKPTNPEVKINTAPQKLEKPVEETKAENKGLGPSLWNASGTWEQRKISIQELEGKIKEAFKNYKTADGKAVIESVTVSGEAHVVFSRGKKGVTYELKVVLNYKGTEGLEDASGEFNFDDFTDHGDRDCTISSKGEANKQTVKKSVIADKEKYIKLIEAELASYKQ